MKKLQKENKKCDEKVGEGKTEYGRKEAEGKECLERKGGRRKMEYNEKEEKEMTEYD